MPESSSSSSSRQNNKTLREYVHSWYREYEFVTAVYLLEPWYSIDQAYFIITAIEVFTLQDKNLLQREILEPVLQVLGVDAPVDGFVALADLHLVKEMVNGLGRIFLLESLLSCVLLKNV